jgi:hypothetical protein
MPWTADGDSVSFTGPLADLMTLIMGAYEEGPGTAEDAPSAGAFITATAVALRGSLMDGLAEDTEAAEFVQRIDACLTENEDGSVTVSTFELLDDIADHIDLEPLQGWLTAPDIRGAIAQMAVEAFES